MASIKELRLRIKSLKNTSKITSAMKMVSAAKLRKAQDAVSRNKPYFEKMREILARVLLNVDGLENPLLKKRDLGGEGRTEGAQAGEAVKPGYRRRYYVVTSDRGLCGSFNNNVLKFYARQAGSRANGQAANGEQAGDRAMGGARKREGASPAGGGIEACGLGRRARDFIQRTRLGLGLKEGPSLQHDNLPTFQNAQAITLEAVHDFTAGRVDEVYLVYNQYKSVLSQVPTLVQLLPVSPENLKALSLGLSGQGSAGAAGEGLKAGESQKAGSQAGSTAGAAAAKAGSSGGSRAGQAQASADYIVEPDPKTLFDELLPRFLAVQVFRALLENAVGEHSARMAAMDAATKNTKDVIASLTLAMNRARQAAITKELIEIVSGAEALKG